MSGSNGTALDRRQIEEEAAQLVVELAGRDDPEARARALAWAARSDRHGVAFAQAQLAWESAARLAATRTAIDADAALDPPPTTTPAGLFHGRRAAILGLAAATLVVGFAGVEIARQPGRVSYETKVGERRTITLADGSRITLNTASRIDVAITATERRIDLHRGEAMFDVAHEAKRPFIVHAGESRMQVLGTAFNVRVRPQVVELTVSRGAVGVQDAGGRLRRVPAGETAAIRGQIVAIARIDGRAVAQRTAWQTGVISLDGQTLEQAVGEFNRYNPTPIVIGDPDLAALRVGGTFGTEDAAKFVQALQSSFAIRVVAGPDRSILLMKAPD